jgi:tRNA A22 N-methylase
MVRHKAMYRSQKDREKGRVHLILQPVSNGAAIRQATEKNIQTIGKKVPIEKAHWLLLIRL